MPELPLNNPRTTGESRFEVTGPNNTPLPAGRYRFRLEVIDDLDQRSDASEVEVLVLGGRPVVRLRAPQSVALGQPIPLEAVEAASPNNVPIRRFVWTRVG